MTEPVDLILKGGLVYCADEAGTAYSPGFVAIKGNRLVAVGAAEVLADQYTAPRVIDATGHVVMPGFVNAHTHLGMGYLRGMADDMKLYDWLGVTFPVVLEAKEEEVETFATVGCIELLRSGVTSVADNMNHLPGTVRAFERTGLRGMLAPNITDFNKPGRVPELVKENLDGFLRYHGRANGRISIMFDLHAPYSCSPDLLRAVRKLADEHKVGIQIHLEESLDERNEITTKYGMSPTKWLDSLGLLGPDVLVAHFVWPDDDDIRLAAERGLRVAHNPASNMKLACGFMPIRKLLDAGIPVGIGTDSNVSSNRLGMLEHLWLTALLHKGHQLDPETVPAGTALRLATSIGAKAIGLADQVGTLEPGKKADVILIRYDNAIHLVPHFFDLPKNVLSHLVYAAASSDVQTVIVDGQILMENRVVTVLDEKELIREAQGAARALLERAGTIKKKNID